MGRNALTGQKAFRALSAAAVLYSAWLLSYVLPTRVGTVDAYVSELTARDQPYRLLYVACDALAGLLSIGVALAAVRTEQARRAPADVVGAWAALGVFGLATMLDVTFPMDCAPSVTAACHTAESLGRVSASHEIHSGTSTVAYAAILLNMALVCRSERRAPGTWPRLGRVAVPLTAVTAVSTAVVLVLVPVGEWVGVPQRVSVLAVAVWLVAFGRAGAVRTAAGAVSGAPAAEIREMSAR
jgi:phosphotransferase system  glucose/maltose/N-acetylglucosamine-specific IIC component